MIPLLLITFHDVQASAAVEARIRAAAAKLARYYQRITSCRVIIEAAQRHQKHGQPYQVHIELHVPGTKLVVRRQPSRRPAPAAAASEKTTKSLEPDARHKDLYVAINDAFAVARRQLETYAEKQRGDVKRLVGRRRAA